MLVGLTNDRTVSPRLVLVGLLGTLSGMAA